MYLRLTLNQQSSCLHFLCVEITYMNHHAQPKVSFKKKIYAYINSFDNPGKKMGFPRTKMGKLETQITFHISGTTGFLLFLLLFANFHSSSSEY
jgi:hypothetical protein